MGRTVKTSGLRDGERGDALKLWPTDDLLDSLVSVQVHSRRRLVKDKNLGLQDAYIKPCLGNK